MKNTYRLSLVLVLVALAGEAGTAQTVRLNQVMRAKLQHSQRILEAVVTSNWPLLENESKALVQITRDPAWSVLQFPEYVRHTSAFVRATDDLIESARLRDLEGASLGFVALSTSCVSCHRYLARARIVRIGP